MNRPVLGLIRCDADGFPVWGGPASFVIAARGPHIVIAFVCGTCWDAGRTSEHRLAGAAEWQPWIDRGVYTTPAALALIEGEALLPTVPPPPIPAEGHIPGQPPQPAPRPGLIRGAAARLARAVRAPRSYDRPPNW